MKAVIRDGLAAVFDTKLVDELLEAHAEAKRNFCLGGLRLSAVEGGRFCEAAFRLLQQQVYNKFGAIGNQLDTESLIKQLSQVSTASQPDSIRIHIPRALRVVYDLRNKRDAAHLADGINPNLQDATLVIAILDWVLAEFVRLYHNISADEAQRIVQELVTRSAPSIQDFEGFLKVLKPDLSASDHCMLLLYQKGAVGATFSELDAWSRPEMRPNLRRTLARLENDKAFVHLSGQRYRITFSGQKEVERRGLLQP
jgi:hypothetical protein